MAEITPPTDRISGRFRAPVANFIVDSIRFRLNLDNDGQYRFRSVHFSDPKVQTEYGACVEKAMVGHTVAEILNNLAQFQAVYPTVAGALHEFLQSLQPVIA